jgi:hypothetical protein
MRNARQATFLKRPWLECRFSPAVLSATIVMSLKIIISFPLCGGCIYFCFFVFLKKVAEMQTIHALWASLSLQMGSINKTGLN